jgi:hypothetical protein
MVTSEQFQAFCSLVNLSPDGSKKARKILLDLLTRSDYLQIHVEFLFGPNDPLDRKSIFAAIRDMISDEDGATHLNLVLAAMGVPFRFRVFWTGDVLYVALELINSSLATEPFLGDSYDVYPNGSIHFDPMGSSDNI